MSYSKPTEAQNAVWVCALIFSCYCAASHTLGGLGTIAGFLLYVIIMASALWYHLSQRS